MTPSRPTLLQMSAPARLVLALAACAVVWAVIALALA
jgi:hypothetical protein